MINKMDLDGPTISLNNVVVNLVVESYFEMREKIYENIESFESRNFCFYRDKKIVDSEIEYKILLDAVDKVLKQNFSILVSKIERNIAKSS